MISGSTTRSEPTGANATEAFERSIDLSQGQPHVKVTKMLELLAIATLLGAAAVEAEPAASEIGRALEMVEDLKLKIVLANDEVLESDQSFFLSDWSVTDEVRRWWERATGTRWLAEGENRIVVRLRDGRVLKLALDSEGEKSNLAEIQTWNEAQGDAEVLDFLVPLHGGNEHFIVMEYARPLGYLDENDPAYRDRQRAWNDLLHQGRSRAMDVPYFNWGMHKGKIRLLDYERWE